MRSIRDGQGRHWDVAVSQESYGTVAVYFAVRAGSEVRRDVLEAQNAINGEQELAALSDDELRARLDAAEPFILPQ